MKIRVNKFMNDLKHPQGCFRKNRSNEENCPLARTRTNNKLIPQSWGVNTKMWVRATLVASTLQ